MASVPVVPNDSNVAEPFVVPVVFPFPETFLCTVCTQVGRATRACGRYLRYGDLSKHLKLAHQGSAIEWRCGVCDFIGTGRYALKSVKTHHAAVCARRVPVPAVSTASEPSTARVTRASPVPSPLVTAAPTVPMISRFPAVQNSTGSGSTNLNVRRSETRQQAGASQRSSRPSAASTTPTTTAVASTRAATTTSRSSVGAGAPTLRAWVVTPTSQPQHQQRRSPAGSTPTSHTSNAARSSTSAVMTSRISPRPSVIPPPAAPHTRARARAASVPSQASAAPPPLTRAAARRARAATEEREVVTPPATISPPVPFTPSTTAQSRLASAFARLATRGGARGVPRSTASTPPPPTTTTTSSSGGNGTVASVPAICTLTTATVTVSTCGGPVTTTRPNATGAVPRMGGATPPAPPPEQPAIHRGGGTHSGATPSSTSGLNVIGGGKRLPPE